MYINYNELIKLVIDLNEIKNNSISDIFEYMDKSSYLDNILNSIDITVKNDVYSVFFMGNYIGKLNSDLYYNTNDNRTKKIMLKYILYKNPNLIVDILYNLININTYNLEHDNNANIKIKRKIFSINNEFEQINSSIYRTNGKIYYYIYNNSELIGIFNYIGDYYTNSGKTITIDDNVKIGSKESVLNNMRHYNNVYFNSIVFSDKTKSK